MHIPSTPVRIAVAGGNYAGLSAMRELYLQLLATNTDYDGTRQAPPNPKVKITLIDRRDGFVHYLGITRGLCQSEYGRKLWVPYSDLPWLQHPSISIKKSIITRIASHHLELADTGEHEEFDYLVVALGQSRTAPIGVAASSMDEYVSDMDKHGKLIGNAQSIVVVGGGAVGTELAADLKTDHPEKEVTLIHSRSLPVPGPFTDEFRLCVTKVLQSLGVKTLFGERVIDESCSANDAFGAEPAKHADILPELFDSVKRNATLTTSSGLRVHGDIVFNCLGATSKASLVDLPSSTGYPVFSPHGIRVNQAMQVDDPKYSHIFAAGDVTDRDLLKLAGAASKGGRLAGTNIAKLINASNGEAAGIISPSREKHGKEVSSPELGWIKLVLGEHHAVIQRGEEVVPTEAAIHMVSPDIKLSKATRKLYIGSYPINGK